MQENKKAATFLVTDWFWSGHSRVWTSGSM